LEDIEEWYSGSSNIHNTRDAGGGIKKVTRVIAIHNELDPILAITDNLTDHPAPSTNIAEGLDLRPNIIDDYNFPKATARMSKEVGPYDTKPIVTVSLVKDSQFIPQKAFDPEQPPGPDINTVQHTPTTLARHHLGS
jgi:hypothetical protein